MNSISRQKLLDATRQFGTPLWLYDADIIRRQIAGLRQFDVIRYAQKACSNTHILKLMRDEGVAIDAVSLGELERALAADFKPEQIVFTADLIDGPTLAAVIELGIAVNAGSLDMLERVGRAAPGHNVWLRANPGFGQGHSNKTNTGGEHSKHGLWLSDLPAALEIVRRTGLKLVGLHMHIGSGVDYAHLSRVCGAMVDAAKMLDHDIRAVSAGGGLSIPYEETDPEIDANHYFSMWDAARREIEAHLGHAVTLEIEPGRYLVGQAGVMVSEIHAVKQTPSHLFALVDAGFNDLMRPAFYGCHHDISLIRSDGSSAPVDEMVEIAVAGPLCEAGDVFTVDAHGTIRGHTLPRPRVGDLLLFHDVGAYGAAMSSNYNSRPLSPEILTDGGELKLIRRRQTMSDLLALELHTV
ncbi:diaminopimelate decarboxylase [Pandoraea terrae]|uniref:diaminopimelate decarboxylase n=1 Tax=Pandoraea terrae TaxID=1537710 RepID=UPI003B837DE4